MPQRLHYAAFALFAILLVRPDSAAAEPASCTRQSLKTDGGATLEACTALLKTRLAVPEKTEALLVRARAALRLERLAIAVPDLELALNLSPDSHDVHIWRGWAHFEQGEYAAAFKRAGSARSLDPKSTDSHILAASIAMRLGQHGRAKSFYDEAVALQPNSPLIRYRYAKLLNQLEDPTAALTQLDALLALPAADTTRSTDVMIFSRSITYRTAAQFLRSAILADTGRKDEATSAYAQLIAEDPCALTYSLRASYRLGSNEAEAAIQSDVDKALAIEPDYWFAHEMQARVHFFAKRYEAAAAGFGRAVDLKPDYGQLRWWRAMALRKIDRLEEATDEALTALAVDPNYVRIEKIGILSERGYLQPSRDRDISLVVADAIRACMLDEECF